MRTEPTQKLNPKIKSVWRINDVVATLFTFIICLIPFLIVTTIDPDQTWAFVVMVIEVVLFAFLVILFAAVLPPIRYMRWKYELNNDFLDIEKGIIWRQRIVIPFIRVQNTDTQQGPILRLFHLANVTVSTAAASHTIPGLDINEAQVLRDKAAELARIAREDV